MLESLSSLRRIKADPLTLSTVEMLLDTAINDCENTGSGLRWSHIAGFLQEKLSGDPVFPSFFVNREKQNLLEEVFINPIRDYAHHGIVPPLINARRDWAKMILDIY